MRLHVFEQKWVEKRCRSFAQWHDDHVWYRSGTSEGSPGEGLLRVELWGDLVQGEETALLKD